MVNVIWCLCLQNIRFWGLRSLNVNSKLLQSVELIEILKQTRLHTLSCMFFQAIDDVLLPSGLLEEGWLTVIDIRYARVAQSAMEILSRNKQRHERCKRLCLGLMAMRRRKQALTNVPFDLVFEKQRKVGC